MLVKDLIKKLQKINPELKIIGFDPYEERLTDKIKMGVIQHSGIESNCWHSDQKFDSNIPKGEYLEIYIG